MKRALLPLVLISLIAVPASSYQLLPGSPKWQTGKATLYYDSATITGAYVSEFGAALSAWNNVSGADFSFTNGGRSNSTNVKSMTNGITDVYFDNLPPFGYAVTYVQNTGSVMTEADVAFNNNITWTASGDGKSPDFRTVAIHEFGHVLGLGHENGKKSVMNSGDPKIPVRSLYPDDIDGLRALYPGSGPGSTGPDLLVDFVVFSPAGAGPGEAVTINFSMRNTGTEDAPGFSASAYLTGSIRPSPTDSLIRSAPFSGLAKGASLAGQIRGFVPSNLLPGSWRVGVILDPTGTVGDLNTGNNGGASTSEIRLERPALAIAPGYFVYADVGPRGTDSFLLELYAGTKLKLSSGIDRGTVTLALRRTGQESVLELSSASRRPKLSVVVPDDGSYTLDLESGYAGIASYSLKTGAKKLKATHQVAVAAETRIPIQAYQGSTVKVTVKARDGLKATVALQGATAESRPNRSGTRTKIGPFIAPETGGLVLVVTPTGGTTGTVSVKVRVKIPKKGIRIGR